MSRMSKLLSILVLSIGLQACLGTIVGTTADVAIEAAKVPFKVGGAVVDVVAGSGKKKSSKSDKDDD